jgi:hypothetical protein
MVEVISEGITWWKKQAVSKTVAGVWNAIFSLLNIKSQIKEGIDFVFEQNPELVKVIYETLRFNNKLPNMVVNAESKQALIDIIQLTESRDIADYVENGNWNNEGDFGFDDKGNVVLIRFADSQEGLTKSGKISSPEELKRLMNSYGGEQIPTSGLVGGMTSFSAQDRVIGTYRIPLSDFKDLLKQGYIQFAGFWNKEFVLSPHIAVKYLTEINNNQLNNQITSEQKQQAKQLYSQYLDTIFPNSKMKDIVYHGTDKEFENYVKTNSVNIYFWEWEKIPQL